MQYKWTALTVTIVGTVMVGIDTRIVIVGLPSIASQLHAGAAEIVWVTQAFVLGSGVALFLIGRASDLFGRVRLYNFGFVIFTIGSLLSAVSQSPYQLISFRVLQGLGAGLILTNSMAIITDASPKNETGLMLGINQTAFRLGSMSGLTLSGVILSITSWRGLFYLSIPIGIFGSIWAYLRLKEISTADTTRRMDWLGFGLFSSGLTLILLAITYLCYGLSGYLQGFSLLAVGIVLIVVFAKWESRISYPVLDLRLFKIRQFAAANLSQLLNTIAWTGTLLLLVFYLQIGQRYTPLQAGVAIVPLEIAFFVAVLFGGKLSDKYESRALCTIGLIINSFSFFTIATFDIATHYSEIVIAMIGVGVGMGLFNSANQRAILVSVPENRRGIASAFLETMNTSGFSTSYGLVILFMTFGISYAALSSLLQGTGTSATLLTSIQFIDGFRIAAFLLAVLNTIAIVPSAIRGESTPGIAVD